ncbi:hypothetical protein AGMMS50256_26870 [Betaproteobacteria bacterium]|nr:hypothetical protein AGMMS50256_26870 [Betaproteobacteria bacterium]
MNPSFFFRSDCVWLLYALLLPGIIPSSVSAQELGPLFFTPEQRQELDRQREFGPPGQQKISGDPTPIDPPLTIDGVVTRSSGKRTVWINGVAQDGQETVQGVTVTPNRKNPGMVVVQPEAGPAARASVGNTLNRNTGEISDLLGGGRIHIKALPSR